MALGAREWSQTWCACSGEWAIVNVMFLQSAVCFIVWFSLVNMNKYSTDVRVFIVLQMARCDENVKAVQRAWQEKFHNKKWPNKRTMARWVILCVLRYKCFPFCFHVCSEKCVSVLFPVGYMPSSKVLYRWKTIQMLWLPPLLLLSQTVQNRSSTTFSLPIRPDH